MKEQLDEIRRRAMAELADDAAESAIEVVRVRVLGRQGELTEIMRGMRDVPQAELEPLLAVGCPNLLYPYVRETVSDLVTRGGFPPVLLAPVSFEALYAQRAQQKSGGPDPRIEISS